MRRMPGGRPSTCVVAGALALVTGLTACTPTASGPTTTAGGTTSGAPATTSAPTPSATASTPPSSTYPADVPAEARANTLAGAAAFARYFFAQVNMAYTKPKAGLIPPLATSECKSCAAFEDTASGYVAAGQHYDRPALEVLEVTAAAGVPAEQPGKQALDVALHQLPAKVMSSSGVVDTIKEQQGVMVVWLSHGDEGWRVTSIKVRG